MTCETSPTELDRLEWLDRLAAYKKNLKRIGEEQEHE
jgi:hypothetical protein